MKCGTSEAYNRNVSLQMASRYGRLTRSSYSRSLSPLAVFASIISSRRRACTSLCIHKSCKILDRALDVVSVPANVKALFAKVSANQYGLSKAGSVLLDLADKFSLGKLVFFGRVQICSHYIVHVRRHTNKRIEGH